MKKMMPSSQRVSFINGLLNAFQSRNNICFIKTSAVYRRGVTDIDEKVNILIFSKTFSLFTGQHVDAEPNFR